MQWIEVENGIVKSIMAAQRAPEGTIVLPDNHQVLTGENVKSYDSNWLLRPLSERVAEGLFTLPEGTKLNGEKIVSMTDIEKMEAGIETIPKGMKIENGELVPMSLFEQVDAGLITKEEAYNRTAEEVRSRRNMLLDESNYVMMVDYSLDDESMWIKYRQTLRDITKQVGFPYSVVLPKRP